MTHTDQTERQEITALAVSHLDSLLKHAKRNDDNKFHHYSSMEISHLFIKETLEAALQRPTVPAVRAYTAEETEQANQWHRENGPFIPFSETMGNCETSPTVPDAPVSREDARAALDVLDSLKSEKKLPDQAVIDKTSETIRALLEAAAGETK